MLLCTEKLNLSQAFFMGSGGSSRAAMAATASAGSLSPSGRPALASSASAPVRGKYSWQKPAPADRAALKYSWRMLR